MNVIYGDLKTAIRKSAKKINNESANFTIDFERLQENVKGSNIKPIKVGLTSRQVSENDIASISEYFTKKKLSWFDEDKYITFLIFVDISTEDKERDEKIDEINNSEYEEVNKVANIVSEYPCCFALVAGYESNDPAFLGKNSYTISCRLNRIAIKSNDNKDKKEESDNE